ncbi:hypothetical protein JCM1393_15930 [Clostridium carnis]
MKASKRERYLLGFLGTILISVVYYQFIYTKQVEKLNTKKSERDQIEERYNNIMNSVKTLEARKEELKVLNANILDKSKKFYPDILQEKVILEIDKLLNDSGLKGNIAFSPIEVAAVENLTSPKINKTESSLKATVDKYNNGNIASDDEKKEGSSTEDETSLNKGEETSTSQQLKVAINFNGKYNDLKKFIASVEGYDKKIVMTNIAITSKSQDEISGTLNLEFYAIPKIGDSDLEYLKWTLANVYGKEILFSDGPASGAYSSMVEENTREKDINDFVMMLRASTSELSTLTLGKAKDESRQSYIYGDKAKVEEVEIEFKEDNGKLYYKYKTSEAFYPKDNGSTGKEFTPVSKDIVLEISSEKRVGNDDSSGIKLKLVNSTKKTVNVIVKDDDSSNPRVTILSEGNTINVTKK